MAEQSKKACSARSLEMKGAKMKCIDIEQWRDLEKGTNSDINVQVVFKYSFDPNNAFPRLAISTPSYHHNQTHQYNHPAPPSIPAKPVIDPIQEIWVESVVSYVT